MAKIGDGPTQGLRQWIESQLAYTQLAMFTHEDRKWNLPMKRMAEISQAVWERHGEKWKRDLEPLGLLDRDKNLFSALEEAYPRAS